MGAHVRVSPATGDEPSLAENCEPDSRASTGQDTQRQGHSPEDHVPCGHDHPPKRPCWPHEPRSTVSDPPISEQHQFRLPLTIARTCQIPPRVTAVASHVSRPLHPLNFMRPQTVAGEEGRGAVCRGLGAEAGSCTPLPPWSTRGAGFRVQPSAQRRCSSGGPCAGWWPLVPAVVAGSWLPAAGWPVTHPGRRCSENSRLHPELHASNRSLSRSTRRARRQKRRRGAHREPGRLRWATPPSRFQHRP